MDNIVLASRSPRRKEILEKLNIFAFLGSSEFITKDEIEKFSKLSMEYALQHCEDSLEDKETGIISFAILTSFKVDDEAIDWIQNGADNHITAFEMPVISDLEKNELYYYTKTPAWGASYYSFLRDFIKSHF